MFKRRVAQLTEQMQDKGIQALMITDSKNRMYLSGFTGSSGVLIVTLKGTYLLTDFRYIEQAQAQVDESIQVVQHEQPVTKTILELMMELTIKELVFEKHHLAYGRYETYQKELEGIHLIPGEDLVSQLRLVKDEQEIKLMEKAIAIADEAFLHIINYIEEGVKERDLSLELEHFMKSQGASAAAFEIIVASGERAALPHGVASDKKLKKGEFVKMDFGAKYQGYCSDITRTVVLGNASNKQKEIYNLVLAAQTNALEMIETGLTAKQADRLARSIIEKSGYGEYFGHGLGHGIGLNVHENPRLSPHYDTQLAEGMTVTIEPGVYIPGFGGVRIEDIIVMKASGCQVLTQSTKELIEI